MIGSLDMTNLCRDDFLLLKLLIYMTEVSPKHGRPVNLCRSARKSDVGDKVDNADMNNDDWPAGLLWKEGAPFHSTRTLWRLCRYETSFWKRDSIFHLSFLLAHFLFS